MSRNSCVIIANIVSKIEYSITYLCIILCTLSERIFIDLVEGSCERIVYKNYGSIRKFIFFFYVDLHAYVQSELILRFVKK